MIKNKKKSGVTITVSREAHELMSRKAFDSKPRLTLRELVNIINNIPKQK